MKLAQSIEARLPDGTVVTLPAGTDLHIPAHAEYREALIEASQGADGNHPAMRALTAAFEFTSALWPDGAALARPLFDLTKALCQHRHEVLDGLGVFPEHLRARVLPFTMPTDHPLAILNVRLMEAAAVLPRDQWEATGRATMVLFRFIKEVYGLGETLAPLVGALAELDAGRQPDLLRPKRRGAMDGWDGQPKPFTELLFRVHVALALDALANAGLSLAKAADTVRARRGDPTLTSARVLGWRKELSKTDAERDSPELREARAIYRKARDEQRRYFATYARSADRIKELVAIQISQIPYVR